LAKAQAVKRLKRAHCARGFVRRAYSNVVASGRVIAQSRRVGKHLAAGAKVDLVISRGRKPKR
jgi:beta-lactam-binding protein with PASTA domain